MGAFNMNEKRRCLVLGGSGALGSEICRTLHREGCEIALTYHTREEAAVELARRIHAVWIGACDLSDHEQVRRCVRSASEKLGGLDAFIQAAGISGKAELYQGASGRRLEAIDDAELEDVVRVNALGTFTACREAHRIMKNERNGNIVVIGSMDGVKGVPSPVPFAMSKAALRGLVESFAHEAGPDGIRINLVAPGILEGGASRHLGEEARKLYLKHCGLKRFGTMAEAAEMAVWLALENTYVTGQCLLLDGGL